MKRLLCIVGSMNPGGAETFLMKVYRTLDKSEYQMDFCVSIDAQGAYDSEIESFGGRIYHISPKTKGIFKSFNSIRKIVKNNNYKYVLRSSQHSLSTLDLIAAKLGGAEKVIYRSNNTKTGGGLINQMLHVIFKPLAMIVPNVKIAPSTEAAVFMFGKKSVNNRNTIIIKNGLNIERYSFDNKIRIEYRKKMGLDNRFIVGHIGRITKQKNHRFLLKIFEEIYNIDKKSILLLIGDGELSESIKDEVQKMKIKDNVLFLGIRSDIPEILSLIDVFIFPSYFEGMPNTVIEAQTSGIPCIISDSITKEVCITDRVSMISLLEPPKVWAEAAIKSYDKYKSNRLNAKYMMFESGYLIQDCVETFKNNVF